MCICIQCDNVRCQYVWYVVTRYGMFRSSFLFQCLRYFLQDILLNISRGEVCCSLQPYGLRCDAMDVRWMCDGYAFRVGRYICSNFTLQEPKSTREPMNARLCSIQNKRVFFSARNDGRWKEGVVSLPIVHMAVLGISRISNVLYQRKAFYIRM